MIAVVETGVTVRLNVPKHKEGDYRLAGKIFATMLVQQGPPPTIFTPTVAAYMATGIPVQPLADEIADFAQRRTLQEVKYLLHKPQTSSSVALK